MGDQLTTEIIEKTKARADTENEITVAIQLGDLGIHSLELSEIMLDIEEAYGIEIMLDTAEAWNKLSNADDVVEATRR
ncbi:acyl carrier protein Nodulation protein F1 [Mesorhizobium plurifarium]|uniref:Acyl carrier protein Nodulation protein F1 n=1 Tax=Mesorhizobium plurifarium TaxID=69974 RepID=A0A0K2VZN8_MESPL|nr:acyl carrier protein Nodulation protein F1 [Mesorhizobium plurifarium]